MMSESPENVSVMCAQDNRISEVWYILLVPLTALAWSVLFNPDHVDLPLMTFHGVLAFVIAWSLGKAEVNANLLNFVAALAITLSSAIISRFTGSQSLGNTIAGIYVLVPGAYWVKQLFNSASIDFVGEIYFNAAIIGMGAWAGTIVCSPTMLGTNVGLLRKDTNLENATRRESIIRRMGTGAALFS